MSTMAIVMMIIALVAVWGGLALALLNLKWHPEEDDDDEDTPPESGPPSSAGPVGNGRHSGQF